MSALNRQQRELLDKPSIESDVCAVCGAKATNRHHVLIKGMGGLPKSIESRIPLIPLCGMGNTCGCHKLAHDYAIEFRYDERDGLWKWRKTKHGGRWYVCFGQQVWKTFGGKA